jgi:type I restriction enzyme, S subunit
MRQLSGWNCWAASALIKEDRLDIGDGYRAKNSEMGNEGVPFARAGNIDNGFHFEDADILIPESVKKANPTS